MLVPGDGSRGNAQSLTSGRADASAARKPPSQQGPAASTTVRVGAAAAAAVGAAPGATSKPERKEFIVFQEPKNDTEVAAKLRAKELATIEDELEVFGFPKENKTIEELYHEIRRHFKGRTDIDDEMYDSIGDLKVSIKNVFTTTCCITMQSNGAKWITETDLTKLFWKTDGTKFLGIIFRSEQPLLDFIDKVLYVLWRNDHLGNPPSSPEHRGSPRYLNARLEPLRATLWDPETSAALFREIQTDLADTAKLSNRGHCENINSKWERYNKLSGEKFMCTQENRERAVAEALRGMPLVEDNKSIDQQIMELLRLVSARSDLNVKIAKGNINIEFTCNTRYQPKDIYTLQRDITGKVASDSTLNQPLLDLVNQRLFILGRSDLFGNRPAMPQHRGSPAWINAQKAARNAVAGPRAGTAAGAAAT